MKKLLKENLLVIIILLLSAFLRFYQLPSLAIFTFDEEHQVTIAKTIVNHFHLIWIGTSASNLGFYLGPFWIYFTSFWLYLSKGDPLITNFVGASIGVITTLVIYLITSKLFSKKAALITGLLYSSLPLFVFFDQKYLTPNPIPLLSLLLMYSLIKIHQSPKWWILFAVCFGLVFHTSLSIIIYGLLGTYLFIRNFKIINNKVIIISCLLFIAILSPLIVFDYYHNWSNITTPLRFKEITQGSKNANFNTRSYYLYETLGRIWYLKPGLPNEDEIPFACGTLFKDKYPNYDFDSIRTKPFWGLSILSIIFILAFLIRPSTWKNLNTKIAALSLILLLTSFLFFHGGPFEYYLLGAFPIILIIVGYMSSLLSKKFFYLSLTLITIVCILGINTTLRVNKSYGLKVKKELISEVMKVVRDNPFELEQNGVCHYYDGWRYLFSVYGKRPERSSTDKDLGWLYPDGITKIPAKYKVIMSEAKVLPSDDISKAFIITKGGFKAYIFELNK